MFFWLGKVSCKPFFHFLLTSISLGLSPDNNNNNRVKRWIYASFFYRIFSWVLLSWLSTAGCGRTTEESVKSLLESGSGRMRRSRSTSFSGSSCSSQVDGWLLSWGRSSLGSLCSSGSELSCELTGLRLPDESKRLLSGGLQGDQTFIRNLKEQHRDVVSYFRLTCWLNTYVLWHINLQKY